MTCWLVSPRVGNVKNNDPSVIEPIAGVGEWWCCFALGMISAGSPWRGDHGPNADKPDQTRSDPRRLDRPPAGVDPLDLSLLTTQLLVHRLDVLAADFL